MDFIGMLSASTLERWERLDAELHRLFQLPDRWLARELLVHARTAREIGEDIFGCASKRDDRYQSELVWDVIPEIAFRLGETSFMPNERSVCVKSMSDANLRNLACDQLHSQPMLVIFASRLHRGLNIYDLLTRYPTAGNPVLFALDRFAPADPHNPDWAARIVNQAYSAMGIDGMYAWDAELDEDNATAYIDKSIGNDQNVIGFRP